MRLPVNRFAALAGAVLLGSCGGGGERAVASAAQPTSGPAADYPMVLGQPFTIEGTTYKPADTMNYDAVGYVAIDPSGGEAITGAHRTLPLPSYVEVTALDSGKTILVRMERRGPMTNSRLVALSPGAMAQLGMTGQGGVGVRVRRVNPPEPERAALRSGQRATARMDTPKSLLAVLQRKLDAQNGMAVAPVGLPITTSPAAVASPSPAPLRRLLVPRVGIDPRAAPTTTPTVAPHPRPIVAGQGSLEVQVAAFSAKARADSAAAMLGGHVIPAGALWRVRMGPFANQAQAATALANARAAGYSDARIQRAD